MAKVYISLGTNLGDKEQNLRAAIMQIEALCGKVEQTSSIYGSAPWGFESFNNFLNQVVLIETLLSPKELMHTLLEIEKELGRNRNHLSGYQDRIIDLDILFYGNQIINEEWLVIPHPKLQERNFVLKPLLEINPNFIHPSINKSIFEIADSSKDSTKAYKK